ncbi:EF-hand calcium-binding domain-containing protein 6 [Rhinophrynus dorsalis]
MNSRDFRELKPHTRGITFADRPKSTPSRTLSRSISTSNRSSLTSSVTSAPDFTLSLLDIENILHQKISENEEDLTKAFMTLDADQNFTVTKGEFYRVLQNFILPLTQPQFDALLAKIPVNSNGTIPYLEFLTKFHRPGTSLSRVTNMKRRWSCSPASQVLNLNEIEIQLRNTISKNMKTIVRSCRLFDYNQNGQIQKHELRRILETHCFKMKNEEYEKLWNRYCIGNKNTLDYKHLLRNLGVNAALHNRPIEDNVANALNWEAVQLEQQKQKHMTPPIPPNNFPEEEYSIDDLHTIFRKKDNEGISAAPYGNEATSAAQYGNNEISAAPYGNESISVAQYGNNAISAAPYGNEAISVAQYGNEAISAAPFGNEAISAAPYGNEAISAAPYGNEAISAAPYGNKAISAAPYEENRSEDKMDILVEEPVNEDENEILSEEDESMLEEEELSEKNKVPDYSAIMGKIHHDLDSVINYIMDVQNKLDQREENWKEMQRKLHRKEFVDVEAYETLKELMKNQPGGKKYLAQKLQMLLQISSTSPNLIKAFRSFDASHTGLISLDAFKSVINNFIFSLPDGTFHELLSRFGFKPTDNIPWEEFIRKFQEPVNIENGQTLPIKSTHRVNPVRGETRAIPSEHILQKLQRHFQEAYPSLKQAFLVLDEEREGRVSRKELRRIVDCMMFRVTDEQFKELMIILDPEHTGFISYHQFLDLFEEKESISGHKWLNNTRQPTKETPIILAWDTMENLLCEKITSNWLEFSKAVQSCDSKASGLVDKDQFKRILQSYCPAFSDEHFKIVCERYVDGSTDCIAYKQFLQNLGVSVFHPGDFNGVSTDIAEGSQFREELRQSQLSDKMKEIENQASKLIRKFTADEVISKLKDCMTKHEFTTKDSFLACNKEQNGKITQKDFRKVLEEHEIHLDNEQFNALTEKLGFTKEGLGYLDFVSLFEAPSGQGPGDILQSGSNHRVNDTRFHYMTAEDCISQFMDKLREGYGDTYSAFYKIDSNRDGIITMHDFRRLLDSFMFMIKPKEYERLLELLGLKLNSTLNYKEFLQLLQRQEKDESPPWLDSLYRPKQTLDCADLACEQAHYYLITKAQSRWHDLAKTFCEMDSEGNGIIQKKDLRNVLFRFSLPVTANEFEKLWSRYDPDGKGYLTHQEFLEKLGIHFAPADSGPSTRIVEENQACLEKHYSNQQKIQGDMDAFHKHQTKALDIKNIEQQIKDKFRENYQDYSSAFAKIDKDNDGLITVQDFRSVLQDLNFHLDDDQFLNLLYRLRVRVCDDMLSYCDFLKFIDDGRASKYGQRREQSAPAESTQVLSPQRALVKLKDKVKSSYDDLCKAFSSFDKDDTGTIRPFELHQILDSFCFPLTDKQFRYLLSKLKLNADHTIDWKVFLRNFTAQEPASTWVDRVQRATRPRAAKELTMKDILAHIQEVVTARFYTIAQEFINLDYATINVVSKDGFREIFNRNFLLLTEDQFENLWNKLPLNAYGNLKYPDFLRRFSGDAPAAPERCISSYSAELLSKLDSSLIQEQTSSSPHPGIRRPKTAPMVLKRSKTGIQRPRTAAICSSTLINCEQAIFAIHETPECSVLQLQNKSKLQCTCEHFMQAIHTGSIGDNSAYRNLQWVTDLIIMKTFNVDMNEEELDQLTVKYDLRNNGRFSYSDFLRNVMLGPKPKENTLLQRMKLHKPRVPLSTGPNGPLFLNTMLRIQPKILDCWRPMRRTFQSCDEARSGYVGVQDFRQVLRKYGINLSEEDFFQILGFFDKDLKAKISYNDFLKEFLR